MRFWTALLVNRMKAPDNDPLSLTKPDMSAENIVIVGGGQAAVQLCIALRKQKVSTPVLMLSEESVYPYHRPPLSKSYLSGETSDEKLSMRPETFYSGKGINVSLDTKVTSINPHTKTVSTNKGNHPYSSLVIATGARPRVLPLEGATIDGTHVLRDLHHSKAIKHALEHAQNVVVIGAGFIGLEFACVANKINKQVTVFDLAERAMARAVSPTISNWFEQTHQQNGIDLRLGDSVAELIGDNKIRQLRTSGGDLLDCDLLVAGIGVVPNDELAKAAGLNCENGVVVNEFCEASEPDIYAAGDCAAHPNPFAAGLSIRLESIQNATDQARVIAAAIAGNKFPYNAVPWFWSDQGEHSLQMCGLSNNADQFVTRGEPANNAFSVFHYLNHTLQSVDSVNSPRDHIMARKLITAGISPTPEQVADISFDLKSLFD